MKKWNRNLSVLLATTLTIATAGVFSSAAGASDVDLSSGGNPPGGWPASSAELYSMFGGAGLGTPQGTLVADSGFRPYPHGFPLPNWGSPESFIEKQLVYGVPTRISLEEYRKGTVTPPQTLNALALRRTLGDGVCRNAKEIDPVTGNCDLILGAELLAQTIETGSLGGHCFGFAAAAAALYNGQLPANQVGASGVGINAMNPMANPAVQTITRLFGTQYLNSNILVEVAKGQSPTKLVETLIEELPSGQVPYVLAILGKIGGHAITPYAVLDRGDGIFDIAVYDNNFPNQARAVTIDTNTNEYIYTSATDPNASSYTWKTTEGDTIALIPVQETLDKQPCPVCRGKDQGTLVAFSSFEAANADDYSVRLVDINGDPLSRDKFRQLGLLNPPTEKQESVPLLVVNPGVEFGVVIQTQDLSKPQPLEIYTLSNGASEYLLMEEIPTTGVFVFGVGKNKAQFQSSEPSSPRMQQLYDGSKTSYDVNGHPLALPKKAFAYQDWNREESKVRFWSTAKKSLRWNVQLTGSTTSNTASWVAVGVKVPAGATVEVDYSQATRTAAPVATVVSKNGTRTNVTMEAVTQSLIDRDRDQIYVSQGPS